MEKKMTKKEWQNSMRVRVDYNNMMAEFLGEEGFTVKEFSDNKKLVAEAYKTVTENRGKGMMGWTELPYNQNKIVEDIKRVL
jgi:glucose-6-phosphate isomerase